MAGPAFVPVMNESTHLTQQMQNGSACMTVYTELIL